MQRAQREHRHGDTGLHVEDTGTVEAPVVLPKRLALELTDRPDGVEMPEQKDSRPRAGEVGADVIAARLARQPVHGRANRLEAPRQFRAAAIDGGLVGARRFHRHQGLDRLAQPVLACLTPIE
jgi:hypothetical protein